MDVMMNMTTEDVRRLRGQFTGSLGLEAFVWLMKRSLRDRIHSELDFVVGVIELFHTIDVNGDAVLDWDEFAGYMMDAGQAKADFYFEGRGLSTKHYVPLSILPPDTKTPLRNITTRIQQMRLLTEQNAMAYFEANSDVVYVYGLQFDHNEGPKHLSTMRLHTAFQEHIVLDVVYVAAQKSLVTSSVLVRGYLSVWSVTDLYSPVMTHRLESFAAQENLCWVPSLKSMATSAVVIPILHSGKPSDPKRDCYRPNGKPSDPKRDCYRPNADTDQPHTKISQLQLWDLSGKLRAPANGTIATKEVTLVEERVKGVTALVAFRSINRTYLAVGREDGILSVVDTETGQEVGAFDAHGSGVKVLIYSNEVESFATVGFHSYADETSLHISTWKKSSLGGMLTHDTTLRQHQAPVEILAFVDSNHQLISVDRTETFNVYSSVVRALTSEPWECLQTFQYSPPPTSNWHLPQKLWSMFVVPETSASDPVLVTAGTSVRFYDYCEVKPREEIVFACYCSALNVVVGATSTKLLLWKGDTGRPWKTYEYAGIIMSTKDPAASMQTDPESREAQARAITAVCVDDRERKIIVGDDTGSIKVVNAVNGNVMKELDPHSHCIVDVSYVLYGKRVLSISSNSILHISDENNPQGFYVPFGGGPIQSVLLQSLRLLPEVEEPEQPSIHHSTRPKSPAKYVILRSTGNEALNLVAVLVANPLGDSFIQLWNFDVSHSQGTCVAPESCGEITCLSFFGSTADIVGGTSTGRVFLWSPVPGTTSYRCISELSTATEKDRPHTGITHVDTVCAPDTKEASSNRPTMKERLELERQCGVHVIASDEAGFVTQWHVRRSSQQVVAFSSSQIARTLSRPSSGTCQARGRVGLSATDTASFQHEEMAINFNSIEALYHHARLKSSIDTSPSENNELLENTAVIDVVEANQQWSAHSGSVLSLEVATDPVAVITSSSSGQIKLWSIAGELHGVLDHFATRRAPLDHPWSFPVDMAARRQQREKEARELLHRPPGSAYRNGLKERVSVLQERLSLTSSELTFTHQRPRSRKGNPRRSEVGRAVRNFILAQTTSRMNTKRKKPPSSAFKDINQDASSLHSVLRELDQFQLHAGSSECSTSRGDQTDTRAKKYSMVTLADVKASVFRPRSTSTVHCDLSSLQDTNNQLNHSQSYSVAGRVSVAPDKRKELYITSAPTPDNKMKLVEFLWQGEASNQETTSDSNVAKPKERRQPRDADGVLRYHVKMAHTWQPYLKR